MPNQLASRVEARTKEEKSQHVTESTSEGEASRSKLSKNALPSPADALFCFIFAAQFILKRFSKHFFENKIVE